MGTQRIQELICELAGPRSGAVRPERLSDKLVAFILRMNCDNTLVYPEEVDLLTAICKLIDAEADGDLAWRKAFNIELTGVFEQPGEIDEIMRGIGYSILRSTVAYISKDGEVASGVLIDIDGRCFLATTAHSIPATPAGKLSFVGNTATSIMGNIPPILASKKDPDDGERDVAFVEIDREFVDKNFGKSAIPLSRVMPCGAGQAKFWTLVGGYPGSEVRDFHDGSAPGKLFTMQAWGSPLLMPDRWDVLPERHRPPDPCLDVFMPYPRDDDFVSCGDFKSINPGQLAEPFGMSGGGYWQPKSANESRLWTPESYSLIAIQSRWWGKGRYLQGTQIIHWLRLVWEHRPELRRTLELAFQGHELSR